MSKIRYNYRLVKIHRNYSIEEVARLLKIHKNTVRAWIKDGLPTCDNTRPFLILGRDLSENLQAKRKKNKRPCKSGEIYCVRCRTPQRPAAGVVEYQPANGTLGSLVGICPHCESMIYRRVNLAKLEQIRGDLDIVLPKALQHINEICQPFVNCDLE
jgi:hypothetical protein